jgi:fibronectin-binding autotransporter adhesin
MNRIYRSIWNASLGAWVATAENVRRRGKGGGAGLWAVMGGLIAAAALQHAGAATLTWDPNGAAAGSGGNGTWDTTSVQWFNGTTFGAWNNGNLDDAVFNAAVAPGAGNAVTLGGAITVHNLTLNSPYSLTGGTLTLGGANPTITAPATAGGGSFITSVIAGTAGLIKDGTGTLNLNGANTYTGITQLQLGVLTLNNAQALGLAGPAASNFVVSGGTSIVFGANINNNFTALGGVITLGGGNGIIWSGSPTLAASTTLSLNTGLGGLTISGALIDTGANVLSVTTIGTGFGGIVTLSGTNTYTGSTDIRGNDVIALGGADALSANSNLHFNAVAGATGGLALTGTSADFTRSLGTGANQVQWLGSGGFYAAAAGVTRIVNIGGAGAPLIWGVTPSFVATANHLVLGSFGGILDFQNPLVVPTAGTTYQIDALGGPAPLTAHARISSVISGAGNLAVGGARSGIESALLELSNANNTYSGSLILNGTRNNGNVMVSTPGALSTAGGLNFAGPVNSVGDTLVLTAGSGDFARAMGTGANQVQWTGNGGFSAAGGNRFVNIGGGAALTWGAGNFVPTGSWLNLAANGDSEIDFRNAINLNGAVRTINIGTGGTARLSGVLSGAGGGITYQGGGVITLTGINTYTGVTTIGGASGTTVNVTTSIGNGGVPGNLGAASNAAANIVLSSGTLNYTGAGETSDRSLSLTNTTNTINNNSATGALSLAGVSGAGGAQLVLGGSAPATAINQLTGVISGAGMNLIKAGATTWRLTGAASTYSGFTAVQGGVLEVNALANGGAPSSMGASSNAAANLQLSSTLRYVGAGSSTDRAFRLGGNGVIESSGTGALVWNPAVALDASPVSIGTHTFGGTNLNDNIFGGAINNNPLASGSNGWNLGVIKAGPGVWILTGNQGYTGNTRIDGGVLYAGAANAVTGGMGLASNAANSPGYTSTTPMSSLIQLNGGVLGLTAASGDFTRNLSTATGSFNNGGTGFPNVADDSFIQGVRWSGSGGFAARGGNRSVNLGGAGTAVFWGAGGFVPNGSALILGASSADSTVTFANPIDLGGVDRTLQADNGTAVVDGVLSGAITGTGGLIKTGDGTAALTGTNTYGGATAVQGGTLQLGNGGATGTLGVGPATLAAGTTIAFNRNNTYSVANTISGPGTLAQIGTGTTTLSAVADSVDNTTVTGGTLDVDQVLTSNTLLMGAGRLNVDGTFQTSANTQVTVSNVAGTASTLQVNAGGTMRVNGDLGDGNDTVLANGVLAVGAVPLLLGDGNDAVTAGGAVTGSGNISLGNGDDTLTLTGPVDISGYTGVFDGGAQAAADTLTLSNTAPLTLAGARVTNFENLVKSNTGIATLTGAHSYSAGSTIAGGTLQVDGTLNTPTVAMTGDGTTFELLSGSAQAVAATPTVPATPLVITGSAGANTVRIASGAALHAGGDLGDGNDVLDVPGTLDIGGGTFNLGAGDDTFRVYDTTNVVGNINAGAGIDTLDVTVSLNVTVPLGGLLGFESLGKSGAGTLQINGPSEFTSVAVHGGTLDVTAAASVTAPSTTVDAGATLNVNGTYNGTPNADTLTVSGTIAGTGPINLQNGDDVLILNDGAVLNNTINGGGNISGDTVALNNANAMPFNGARTVGFEKLLKSNTGIATITADQSYPGGATLAGGTLAVNPAVLVLTPTVTMSAGGTTLVVNGTLAASEATPTTNANPTMITGSAGVDTVRVGATGTLRAIGGLGADNDLLDVAGVMDIGSSTGTFDLGPGDDTFRIYDTTRVDGNVEGGIGNDELNVNVSAGNLVPLGGLGGFESLGKSGAGTLQINGLADFVTVDLEGGTLHVTTNAAVQAQQTSILAGATLLVDGAYRGTAGNDTMTVAGTITGPGTVDLGAGDDTLTIRDGADLSGLANPISGGTGNNTLVTDIAASATLGGVTNFQTLTKTNTGTLNVNGPAPSDFSTVNVMGGTLAVGPAGSITGVAATTVAVGATLNVNGAYTGTAGGDTMVVKGAITGTGRIDLSGGDDRVELHGGATIAPTTFLDGGAGINSLVLTGTTDGSFDVSILGANAGTATVAKGTPRLSKVGGTVENFEVLRKEGAGTWTLTGVAEPSQNWTIAEGTLVGNSDSLQGKINNQSMLVFDQAADGVYASVISGPGTMTKSGAGMLDLTGANTMTGLTTVDQGRLQVTGSIASPVKVNAGGTLGGTGVVHGSVTNAGTVAPGTPSGVGTLTIQGDYISNAGHLGLHTVFGTDNSPTDRLVIDGGTVTGATLIEVANRGGLGALTTGRGINIVSLLNGATQPANAFVLGGPVVVGPFQYDLHEVDDPVQGSGWFLRSNDTNPNVTPAPPSPSGEVISRVVAASSPEVSLNNSLAPMAQLYGMQSLSTWQTRHGNADSGLARDGTHTWVRTFGEHGNVRGGGLQSRGADFGYNSIGLQGGADVQLSRDGPIEDRVGGYASAGSLRSNVQHFNGTYAGTASLRAYSVGGYWTRTSQEGWYLDAVAQYTHYDKVQTASIQGIDSGTTGWGMAASLEAGKSFKLSDTVSIEPQAQLIVQRTRLNDERDTNLTDIALGTGTSVLGRVGTRLVHKWFDAAGSPEPLGSAWVRVNPWQEFSGKTSNTYQTASGPLSFASKMAGSWGELELGFSSAITQHTSIFGSIAYHRSINGTAREGASFSTGVNTGGVAMTGVGLSTQLSPNVKLVAKAGYGNGGNGINAQAKVVNANVNLDVKW